MDLKEDKDEEENDTDKEFKEIFTEDMYGINNKDNNN